MHDASKMEFSATLFLRYLYWKGYGTIVRHSMMKYHYLILWIIIYHVRQTYFWRFVCMRYHWSINDDMDTDTGFFIWEFRQLPEFPNQKHSITTHVKNTTLERYINLMNLFFINSWIHVIKYRIFTNMIYHDFKMSYIY